MEWGPRGNIWKKVQKHEDQTKSADKDLDFWKIDLD